MAKYSFKKGQALHCVNGNNGDAITGQTYICNTDIETDSDYDFVSIRNLDGSEASGAAYVLRFRAVEQRPEQEPEKPKEWVVCVDAYCSELTLGKQYAVVKRDTEYTYVKGNMGVVGGHFHRRFARTTPAQAPQRIAISESTFVEMLKPYERQYYNKRQPSGLSYLRWLVQTRYPHVTLVIPAPKPYTIPQHVREIKGHAAKRRLLIC